MWYINDPIRWELEQESLRKLGIDYQVDEEVKTRNFLRLHLIINQETKIDGLPDAMLPLELVVFFPSAYPYFRPEVSAPNLTLARHQNILSKTLCLLPRPSGYWLPETTIGEYLAEQLPKVLKEGEITDKEALKANTDEQGEPVSDYYPAVDNAPVIMETNLFDSIPQNDQDIAFIGSIKLGLPKPAAVFSRMWAIESFDAEGALIGQLSGVLSGIFPARNLARLYRIKQRPPHGNPQKDYVWLVDQLRLKKADYLKHKHPIQLKNGTVDEVIGLTFLEEHTAGQESWGWLFLVAVTLQKQVVQKKKAILIPSKQFYYAKVNRMSKDEMAFRIPSLTPLANKTVAIFGIGALGGPLAVTLAKNGVGGLKLIDFDTVSAGTIVRWPLGATAVGMYKTEALGGFIKENYPYCEMHLHRFKIGASESYVTEGGSVALTHEQFVDEALRDVSMIVDAAAETGVSHFLSEEAKKRAIPFVSLYGTPGVWGGAVMRHLPGLTEGCWMCFQYALRDGLIPNPPTNRSGNIQAAGCGDISFTGTSFELDNIVSAGVRLVVSILSAPEHGYSDLNGDVGILSLVDDHGHNIFPRWSTYQLLKHPDCPYCHIKKDETQSLD